MEWGNVPLVAVVHPGKVANDIRCTLFCFTSWSQEQHGAILPFILRSLVDEAPLHVCSLTDEERVAKGVYIGMHRECTTNQRPTRSDGKTGSSPMLSHARMGWKLKRARSVSVKPTSSSKACVEPHGIGIAKVQPYNLPSLGRFIDIGISRHVKSSQRSTVRHFDQAEFLDSPFNFIKQPSASLVSSTQPGNRHGCASRSLGASIALIILDPLFTMEDFNSETDSDYTSYWRDWVGLFFLSLSPHFQLAAAHLFDPLISFLLGPRLRHGHHASSSVKRYASLQPVDRIVTALSHLKHCGGSSISMDYREGAIQTAWQQLQ